MLRDRLMVGPLTLDQVILVRIQVPQHWMEVNERLVWG